MIWTAWNNGEHHVTGGGYGFKIDSDDRDRFFDRGQGSVIVILPSQPEDVEVVVNTKKSSFWNETCRELINKKIGQWFIKNNHAPWPVGNPPKFNVQLESGNRFRLIEPTNP